ncbi:MAG: hypothetical protein EXS05_12030 [Planctomycetaceae bacterium]|nr:hypothetical protein [Planctomycetaceae bacterium]
MSLFLAGAATLGWLSLPVVIGRLRRGLRKTSLDRLWLWLVAAWIVWGLAGAAGATSITVGAVDLAWYSVAVIALVPPIAVLGARRPIHRAWPWFVLLPLMCVFSWPAFSALAQGWPPAPWTLEEPVLAGYVLVLIMGAGNYLGLRYTVPALLWTTSLFFLVGSLCPATVDWMPPAAIARSGATLLIVASAWLATWTARRDTARRTTADGAAFDRVWLDFRDTFGVVWARRVQERFNEGMRHQAQNVRLGINGLESADRATQAAPPIDPMARRSAEKALRWLLQKFVDSEWIDARLVNDPGTK